MNANIPCISPSTIKEGFFCFTKRVASATNLEKEVTIYNTLGQQVQKAKVSSDGIDVSNLNKGTYFVKITEDGKTATKKLVIQ